MKTQEEVMLNRMGYRLMAHLRLRRAAAQGKGLNP